MELFCRICSDMIDDKDTNMYKSVLYGSRQIFFCIMHPFVIISYIIVFDVQCIHICLLRVLDW